MQRSTLLMMALFCLLVAGPALAHDHDPPRMMAADVMAKLNSGEEVVFLDTRTDAARASIRSEIPNAIQIKTSEILNMVIRETPKESLVVTYCT